MPTKAHRRNRTLRQYAVRTLAVGIAMLPLVSCGADPQHPFASWDPSGKTLPEARAEGNLIIEGQCVFIADLSVALPQNAVWDEESRTLSFEGATFTEGEQVVAGGGGGAAEDTSGCEVTFFAHSLSPAN